MARAPRAKVSKTAGQGISRLAYQQGRALGNKGVQVARAKGKSPSIGNTRSYAKEDGGAFNVAYGGMFDVEDAEETSTLPKPSVRLDRGNAKKMKGPK